MNKKEYIEFHERATERMRAITAAKNSDYTGTDDDPFANFKKCTRLCSMEVGIMVRLSDKVARLESFLQKGSYEVRDESFEDTCLDLANYAIILAAARYGAKAEAFRAEREPRLTSEMLDEDDGLTPSTRAALARAP